ncbi:MAG: hypothetical protein CL730_03820 [Chloroflexi bacterium]|jgi:hypothetical protein|nr:hypothetical protein [Chloroflexota bacterium]|tara:strand:+ start:20147 stop:20869 length:723 start_codon:yes stop_codon:yes gene_type:complete
MQKFLPSEKKIIENIIIKIENIWFSKYELSKDLPKDLRIPPWKYESIVLQKLLCEQNGTFLQDNIKNIKYLDKWNASLTLYESRIKLCNQRVKVNFREGQYIYETDNAYQIFDDIGILSNILDSDINNAEFNFNDELIYESNAATDGSKLFSLEMIFPDTTNWCFNNNVSQNLNCAHCGQSLVIRKSIIEEDNNRYFVDCDSKSRHGGEEIRSGVCITGTRNSNGWIGWVEDISNNRGSV